MALAAHMKTHDKRPDKTEEIKEVSVTVSSPVTPGTKSKRVAAQKYKYFLQILWIWNIIIVGYRAANLLRELKDDLKDAPTQTPLNKAVNVQLV